MEKSEELKLRIRNFLMDWIFISNYRRQIFNSKYEIMRVNLIRTVWRRDSKDSIEWPNERGQKDKQLSTTTQRSNDWTTQTLQKTEDELRKGRQFHILWKKKIFHSIAPMLIINLWTVKEILNVCQSSQ